jgi:lysophospholipase L1-like esterase
VGLVLALLASLLAASTSSATVPDEPVRILIVGDSMTQGSSGDWTWRYRLWQHLTEHHVSFDFVGPRDDLWDNVSGSFGSQAYVDPAFDRDHAARWGRSMALVETGQGDLPVGEMVQDYQPDVVVEMLGVNDLQFLGESPQDLEGVLRQFIADARSADPHVDLVLGRLPQPWIDKVPAFNARVDAVAAELSTADSRIVSAQSDAGLIRTEDTWETFHPNARGDVKIAAGVADALSSLGIGPPADRPLPEVPRGPRIRPVLTATSTVRALHLMWQRSPGAQESEVFVRDVTTGEAWHQVAAHLTGTTYDATGLPAWHSFQLQVVPTKWNWRALEDAWSNVVEVQTLDDHLDRPAATTSTATAEGVATVGWAAVPGATSYAVQWRRTDQPDGWLGTVTVDTTSTAVTGLANRTGYAFRVRALRGVMAGGWSDETTAAVPALAAVRGAQVRRSHGALKASARRVALATSYTLRAAPTASCSHPPRAGRFDVVAAGLSAPRTRFRLEADAVWVRWVAVRGGVEGDLAPSSTACLKLLR